MKGHKLVSEDDKSFKILSPDGDTFSVSKKHLDDAGIDKILGMEKAQSDAPTMDQALGYENQRNLGNFSNLGLLPNTNSTRAKDDLQNLMEADQNGSGQFSNATNSEIQNFRDFLQKQGGPNLEGGLPNTSKDPYDFNSLLSGKDEMSSSGTSFLNNPNSTPYQPDPSVINQGAISQGQNASPQAQTQGQAQAQPMNPMQQYSQMLQTQMGKTGPILDQIAAAKKQEADQMAKVYSAHAIAMQNLVQKSQDNMKSFQKEYDTLSDSVKNNQIDPTRAWTSMSTGNKVLAGIGIMLSGAGSGMTGQRNLALDQINKMIDNDIQAQMKNQSNRLSMLQLNIERYGKNQLAIDATRNQYQALLAGWIGKIGAQSASKQVQANAELAKQQLGQSMYGSMQGMADKLAQMQLYGAGTGEGGIHKSQMPFSMLSNDKLMEKMVEVNDHFYPAYSDGEATKIRSFQAELPGLKHALDELHEIGRMSGSTLQRPKINRLKAEIIGILKKMEGFGGAPSHEDVRLLEQMSSNPTAFFQGKDNDKALYKAYTDRQENYYRKMLRGYSGKSGLGARDLKLKGN